MPARLIPIGIALLLVTACGSTEFVSPLRTPLPTAALPESTPPPSPLETPTPEPVPTAMPIGAVIVSPVYGSVVQGQVEIIGTAAHPEFERYELFYGPCPISGELWCSIGDAVFQQVHNGVLGVWNTMTVPNGIYQLQLRVVRRDGNYEASVMNGITVTNTQYLTATPRPTWTPSPTFTPTSPPTIIPPIHTANPNQLPRITHDLLFLGKYSLMRWNHTTGQIEALVTPEAPRGENWQHDQRIGWTAGPGSPDGSVSSFSVSADGQKVALARSRSAIRTEIAVLNMSTGQITLLVPAHEAVSRAAISPDGEWVAYIHTGSLPIPTPPNGYRMGLAVPPAQPVRGGGTSAGMIYAVQTNAPDRRIDVGYCAEERTQEYSWPCAGFIWSPDSHKIAWSDGRGTWVAELGQPPRQLTVHMAGSPPSGVDGVLDIRSWSPLGRYILVWIRYYEGSSQGVIDTQTGRVADIPAAFEYAYPGSHIAWMQDGRLLVARHGNLSSNRAPSIEVWRVDGDLDPMLYRETEIALSVGPENYVIAPAQLTDGRLALTVVNGSPTNYTDRGLYFVDLNNLLIQKVNGLPPAQQRESYMGPGFVIGTVNMYWSPDGSGAIFEDLGFHWEDRLLLYVPTDGSSPVDLRPVMDEGDFKACCFMWTR